MNTRQNSGVSWRTAKWDEAQLKTLRYFIRERESIRLKKEAGLPFPWTEDPLLQRYHWCNCHHKDDRVSRWIAEHWSKPYADHPDLWFALLVARRATNHPDTMAELGYPVPWNADRFLKVFADRTRRGEKVYHTPAYRLVLQTDGAGTIAERLERHVLTPMWQKGDFFRPRRGDTLTSFHERLASAKFLGQFYSGQIVADLKHHQLRDAPDWLDFAVPGLGSVRGLNRLLGLPVQFGNPEGCSSWPREKRDEWHLRLLHLRTLIGLDGWELQDVQATLCEFDKFQRLVTGDGHYVRRYTHNTVRETQLTSE